MDDGRGRVGQLQRLREDEEGLSTVEYIIILVLIAVIGIVAWQAFGDAVTEQVDTSTDEIIDLGS